MSNSAFKALSSYRIDSEFVYTYVPILLLLLPPLNKPVDLYICPILSEDTTYTHVFTSCVTDPVLRSCAYQRRSFRNVEKWIPFLVWNFDIQVSNKYAILCVQWMLYSIFYKNLTFIR